MTARTKFSAKIANIRSDYFDPGLGLRVQAFNLLAFAGMAAGALTAVSSVLTGAGAWNTALNLSGGLAGFFMLRFARRGGRYHACFLLTVVVVFIALFPVLFFTAGGYRSGMPCFFIFAMVFTALMLEGAGKAVFIAAELAVYAACCLAAYAFPGLVTSFPTERGYALDVMTGVSVAGLALVAVVELYIRVYDNRQRRLEDLDRRKTELFANVSHEMKTPLTVVSVHIQRAEALFGLARDGLTLNAEARGKIRESFTLARDEIMRMSRLVDSALRLSSLRDGGGRRGPLDMGAILRASADEMAQVISNLLSNANSHTHGGEIRVSAASEGAMLAVTVWDNGAGISPDILPRAFDRGVTDGGGNGLGLSICRQIVASHGGEIAIDGEPGRGARVRFTLPLYSGEEGGAA